MQKLLFSLLFLLFSVAAVAQVSVSARAGLNYSHFNKISGEFELGSDLAFEDLDGLSYHTGVAAEFVLSERVSLLTELLYSEKGGGHRIFSVANTLPDTRVEYRFSYINLPIAGKIKAGNFGIVGGAELGYTLGGKIRTDQTDWTAFPNSVLGRDNEFDLGLLIGAEYNLGNFALGLRYIHGLAKVLDTSFTDTSGDTVYEDGFRNRTYQLYVSYRFLNGKSE